eukprot:jgi/Psemu1/11231/gm1.11231_g
MLSHLVQNTRVSIEKLAAVRWGGDGQSFPTPISGHTCYVMLSQILEQPVLVPQIDNHGTTKNMIGPAGLIDTHPPVKSSMKKDYSIKMNHIGKLDPVDIIPFFIVDIICIAIVPVQYFKKKKTFPATTLSKKGRGTSELVIIVYQPTENAISRKPGGSKTQVIAKCICNWGTSSADGEIFECEFMHTRSQKHLQDIHPWKGEGDKLKKYSADALLAAKECRVFNQENSFTTICGSASTNDLDFLLDKSKQDDQIQCPERNSNKSVQHSSIHKGAMFHTYVLLLNKYEKLQAFQNYGKVDTQQPSVILVQLRIKMTEVLEYVEGRSLQRKVLNFQVKQLKMKTLDATSTKLVVISSNEAQSLKQGRINILLKTELNEENGVTQNEVDAFATRVFSVVDTESRKLSGHDKQVQFDYRMNRRGKKNVTKKQKPSLFTAQLRKKMGVVVSPSLLDHILNDASCYSYFKQSLGLVDFASCIFIRKSKKLEDATQQLGLTNTHNGPQSSGGALPEDDHDSVSDDNLFFPNDDDEEEGSESTEAPHLLSVNDEEGNNIDVDNSHCDSNTAITTPNVGRNISDKLKVKIKLMKIMRNHSIPLVAEKELYEWAIESEQLHLFSWTKGNLIKTRASVMKEISTIVPEIKGDGFEPHLIDWCSKKSKSAKVSGRKQIYVRSFQKALHSLLTNVTLVKEDYLSFPQAEDPTLPVLYPELQGNIDIDKLHHSGSTLGRRDANPNPMKFCGQTALTPLNMTLGIFNTLTRNSQPDAWEAIYYHPICPGDKGAKSIDNVNNLHSGLRLALSS